MGVTLFRFPPLRTAPMTSTLWSTTLVIWQEVTIPHKSNRLRPRRGTTSTTTSWRGWGGSFFFYMLPDSTNFSRIRRFQSFNTYFGVIFLFYRSENRYLRLETSLWRLVRLTSSCTGRVRSQMYTISFFLGWKKKKSVDGRVLPIHSVRTLILFHLVTTEHHSSLWSCHER